jgi:hypothetical protein
MKKTILPLILLLLVIQVAAQDASEIPLSSSAGISSVSSPVFVNPDGGPTNQPVSVVINPDGTPSVAVNPGYIPVSSVAVFGSDDDDAIRLKDATTRDYIQSAGLLAASGTLMVWLFYQWKNR